ncbi:MAG: YCF48-related protein [Bacteroidales bacterium]|jgi:photosystem II stability/assembly factor-like uncharacterized protein
MKKLLLLSISLLLLFVNKSSATWSTTPPITGLYRIDGLYFTSTSTGYLIGNTDMLNQGTGKIAKTTNGGTSWTVVKSLSSTSFSDIYFVNSTNTGFVVGSGGLILKTTDGGNNWAQQVSNTTEALESVFFLDVNNGYAGGGSEVEIMLKTTDGGVHWDSLIIPNGYSQRIHGMFFTSTTIGYAIGGDPFGGGDGNISHTTNGGVSWDTLPSGVKSYFDDVCFINANTGFIVGYHGLILKTTNAGQSWTKKNAPNNEEITKIRFASSTVGYACNLNGEILKTFDAGEHWIIDVSTPAISEFYAISFPSADIGYAAGLSMVCFKMNGASNQGVQENQTEIDNISLFPNPCQHFLNITIQNTYNEWNNIEIFNIEGQVIFCKQIEKSVGEIKETINIENYPKGIYIFRILGNNAVKNEKIVIN